MGHALSCSLPWRSNRRNAEAAASPSNIAPVEQSSEQSAIDNAPQRQTPSSSSTPLSALEESVAKWASIPSTKEKRTRALILIVRTREETETALTAVHRRLEKSRAMVRESSQDLIKDVRDFANRAGEVVPGFAAPPRPVESPGDDTKASLEEVVDSLLVKVASGVNMNAAIEKFLLCIVDPHFDLLTLSQIDKVLVENLPAIFGLVLVLRASNTKLYGDFYGSYSWIDVADPKAEAYVWNDRNIPLPLSEDPISYSAEARERTVEAAKAFMQILQPIAEGTSPYLNEHDWSGFYNPPPPWQVEVQNMLRPICNQCKLISKSVEDDAERPTTYVIPAPFFFVDEFNKFMKHEEALREKFLIEVPVDYIASKVGQEDSPTWFISHKWSGNDPDPGNVIFNAVQSAVRKQLKDFYHQHARGGDARRTEEEEDDENHQNDESLTDFDDFLRWQLNPESRFGVSGSGLVRWIWFDYSCVPQDDPVRRFQHLRHIPQLMSGAIVTPFHASPKLETDYLSSVWCQLEAIVARGESSRCATTPEATMAQSWTIYDWEDAYAVLPLFIHEFTVPEGFYPLSGRFFDDYNRRINSATIFSILRAFVAHHEAGGRSKQKSSETCDES